MNIGDIIKNDPPDCSNHYIVFIWDGMGSTFDLYKSRFKLERDGWFLIVGGVHVPPGMGIIMENPENPSRTRVAMGIAPLMEPRPVAPREFGEEVFPRSSNTLEGFTNAIDVMGIDVFKARCLATLRTGTAKTLLSPAQYANLIIRLDAPVAP